MKKLSSIFLTVLFCLTFMLSMAACQERENPPATNAPVRNVIDLTENNYWKYIVIDSENEGVSAGSKGSVSFEISGTLGFALYEDVVFSFDVIYYTQGQPMEEHQSYTMRIACNAAGNACFETTYLGTTNVTVGKWLGTDKNLVSLANYNWKIHFNSVSGKVIYTA